MGTFKKHLDAIKAGQVTKSNVIGLKKATSAFERRRAGYSTGMTAPDWTVKEMQEIATALRLCQPTVTGELHTTGVKQLRDRRYAKRWSAFERSVIDRIERFSLVAIIGVGRRSYAAVFKAIAADGQGFFFYNVPWQTADAEGVEGGPHAVEWSA